MLVSRCGAFAVAILMAACGSAPAVEDSGRDGWSYDARVDIAPRVDASARDVVDVSPTVDVVAFDVMASDVASDRGSITDAAPNPCPAIAEQYARAVRDAQACHTATDCGAIVCETLCCTCQVYVNGATAEAALITPLQQAWETHGCAATVTCIASVCGGVASTDCTSAGRCATVHRAD